MQLLVPALLLAGCAGPSAQAPFPEEIRLELPAPSVEPPGSRTPELAPLPSRTPRDDTDPPVRASGADDPAGPVHLQPTLDGSQPPPELAAAILAAYTAFWDSYWDAARHPVDPEHPGIGRHSTEPVHSRTVGVLLGRATEGVALHLPADHGTGRVVRIEGWDSDSAEVTDCFVDTAVLYEVATGRVRNDEQATVVHLALLRHQGGAWRVAEIFEQAIHTGRTDGCTIHSNAPAAPLVPEGPPVADRDDAEAAVTPSSPW